MFCVSYLAFRRPYKWNILTVVLTLKCGVTTEKKKLLLRLSTRIWWHHFCFNPSSRSGSDSHAPEKHYPLVSCSRVKPRQFFHFIAWHTWPPPRPNAALGHRFFNLPNCNANVAQRCPIEGNIAALFTFRTVHSPTNSQLPYHEWIGCILTWKGASGFNSLRWQAN